jgi:DNA-binding response OmpR family regulator
MYGASKREDNVATKGKILLLEDDRLLGQTIEELLCDDGYDVTWVADGGEAADAAYETAYDLYVFDINVPDIDGFELLEDLRSAQDRTPTIFISAQVDIASIAKGFSLGAEDYLKKPFFPEELLIRVNTKLGRKEEVISCGEITYDPRNREVRRNGELLAMGSVIFQMFDLFIHNPSRVIDKEELMGCMEHPSDNALRVAVTKLKQITGLNIKNIRGVGYTLETS